MFFPNCTFQIALFTIQNDREQQKLFNSKHIHSLANIHTQTPIQQQNQRKHSKKHCGNNGKSDYKWVSEQIGRDNQPYIAANKFPMQKTNCPYSKKLALACLMYGKFGYTMDQWCKYDFHGMDFTIFPSVDPIDILYTLDSASL